MSNYAVNTWHTLSNEAYHSDLSVGSSMLKTLAQQSPMHLHSRLTEPAEISAATQATLDFGTMVHAATLEPEEFSKNYVAEPVFEKKAGTTLGAQRAEWAATQPGKIIVSKKDLDKAAAMTKAVYAQPYAAALLKGGSKEKSAWWYDEGTNIKCKFRPDCVSADGKFLVDVKTTADASKQAFMRQADNLMYHMQAAHYLEGARRTGLAPEARFVFIAVEKTPPYAVVVYEASETLLSLGEDWRRFAMQEYSACCTWGQWPAYEPAQTLDLPPWAKMPPVY